MKFLTLLRATLFAVVSLPLASPVSASSFPERSVRILVPFTAGTNADIVARLFAKHLSERNGQPFVVESRPGAGGVVASQSLLSAPADGYTLMFVSSAHAANPSLNKKLPYDTIRDFSGIAMVGEAPVVVAVHPNVGVRTQAELIALAKQRQAKGQTTLDYSSPGIGSAANFACEFFNAEAGIEMQQIPFKGTEYVFELLSGRVQMACPPVGLVKAHIETGKLLALSVSSQQRDPLLPDVPTAKEAGLPNYEYGIWYGLLASPEVPKDIIEKLSKEMLEIVGTQSVVDTLAAQGIIPKSLPAEEFDKFIVSQIELLSSIAKKSGIAPN